VHLIFFDLKNRAKSVGKIITFALFIFAAATLFWVQSNEKVATEKNSATTSARGEPLKNVPSIATPGIPNKRLPLPFDIPEELDPKTITSTRAPSEPERLKADDVSKLLASARRGDELSSIRAFSVVLPCIEANLHLSRARSSATDEESSQLRSRGEHLNQSLGCSEVSPASLKEAETLLFSAVEQKRNTEAALILYLHASTSDPDVLNRFVGYEGGEIKPEHLKKSRLLVDLVEAEALKGNPKALFYVAMVFEDDIERRDYVRTAAYLSSALAIYENSGSVHTSSHQKYLERIRTSLSPEQKREAELLANAIIKKCCPNVRKK
jgi:hypothetical protein